MPELPEVEHAAERLATAAVGKRLVAIRALHPAVARGLDPDASAGAIGRAVVAVERRGKYQLVRLTGDLVVVAHFRMAGDWHAGRADDAPRHSRAVIEFDDGSAVYLVDSRALATLAVRPQRDDGIPELGPDAASPALTAAALGPPLRGRRGSIKVALLDQRTVAGLGNIYAAESLWRARIDPLSPSSSLSTSDVERLVEAIRDTLAAARIDPGRYSRGEGLDRLTVYGREGKPCPRCATAVARVVQGGRSTYYCPGCQTEPSRGRSPGA